MHSLIREHYGVIPSERAEASLVGALLVSSEIIPEAVQEISPEEFLIPEYQNIYKACIAIHSQGKPVDHIAVLSQLKGEEYKPLLATCIQLVPSTKNWMSYAEIIRDTYKRYSVVERGITLIDSAKGEELDTVRENAILAVEALTETHTDDTWDASQMFTQFMLSLQKEPEYQKTGISNLDRHLYLESGDFVVIGARPSVGKTALGVQVGITMAKGLRVGFFSLETSRQKIAGRTVGNYGNISQSMIKSRDKNLNMGEIANLYSNFSSLGFHVIQCAGWTVQQIQAKAVQLELDVAFIDYLQLIRSNGGSRYEKVTNISQELSTMARARGITTFALAQLNREGTGVPTMEDLRESGQIEQDADAILLLHSVDQNQDPARKLYIAKNKEGITGTLNFAFDGDKQTFTEITTYGEGYNL